MHICCWIVLLQHYAKMTKCSISQITEISWGEGGSISMEFALYTSFAAMVLQKRKHKKIWPQFYVSCETWHMFLMQDCHYIGSLPTPVMEPQGIAQRDWAWLYWEQLRKIAGFGKVELTVYGHGLQVFIVLPRVLPHIPILVLEINPAGSGERIPLLGSSSTKVLLGALLYWFLLTCTFVDLWDLLRPQLWWNDFRLWQNE